MSGIKVGCSPLTNVIYAGRTKKSANHEIWTSKEEVTEQAIVAVYENFLNKARIGGGFFATSYEPVGGQLSFLTKERIDLKYPNGLMSGDIFVADIGHGVATFFFAGSRPVNDTYEHYVFKTNDGVLSIVEPGWFAARNATKIEYEHDCVRTEALSHLLVHGREEK